VVACGIVAFVALGCYVENRDRSAQNGFQSVDYGMPLMEMIDDVNR
jgi:hypothetical protein